MVNWELHGEGWAEVSRTQGLKVRPFGRTAASCFDFTMQRTTN